MVTLTIIIMKQIYALVSFTFYLFSNFTGAVISTSVIGSVVYLQLAGGAVIGSVVYPKSDMECY